MALKFGVSDRTIKRDIVALSGSMGIPIYCQCGRYYGGVYIVDSYNMDRMYMNEQELALLQKVKSCADQQGPFILSEQEKTLLQSLIQNYTKPSCRTK